MPTEDKRISLVERAVQRMEDQDGKPAKQAAKKPAKSAPASRVKTSAKEPAKTQAARAKMKTGGAVKAAKPVAPQRTPAQQKAEDGGSTAASEANPPIRLDLATLRKKGMITPSSGRSILVEDMRAVKRPLLKKAFPGNDNDSAGGLDNVVMISSCRSGEGKTFTTVNLAMSIAMERDLYVLLIDTDVYRRGACELLGIEPRKGLVDLAIETDLEVSDVMQRTNIENLSVIQAGTLHPHATELLASQRMLEIISSISARYPDRMVVIDTPPVLDSSEPGIIAGIAGQVVLVVEEGKTNKQEIDLALEALREAKSINFILNKQRGRRKRSSRYDYSAGAYS